MKSESSLRIDISEGLSIKDIASKHFISESTVRRKLFKYGIKKQHFKPLKLSVEKQTSLIKDYKNGMRGYILSKKYNISVQTIYSVLRKNNIKVDNAGSKCGKDNPNWKGGITSLRKGIRASKKYSQWRLSVFERDKFRCKICKNLGGKLEAHHLIRYNTIICDNNIKTIKEALKCKELWYVSNGITVCYKCHKKIHKEEGR